MYVSVSCNKKHYRETVVHAFMLPLPTSKTSFLTDLYPGDLVECSGPSISKETIIPTVEQVAGYHYLQYCVAACGKSQKKTFIVLQVT